MSPPDDGPSRDNLRRLEARFDARFQELNARFVLHDGRFAAMGDRVNQTDRRLDALGALVDSRLRSVDRRFDGVESRLDQQDARLQELVDRLVDVEVILRAPWWSLHRRASRRGRGVGVGARGARRTGGVASHRRARLGVARGW